jgi:hypothetical protein
VYVPGHYVHVGVDDGDEGLPHIRVGHPRGFEQGAVRRSFNAGFDLVRAHATSSNKKTAPWGAVGVLLFTLDLLRPALDATGYPGNRPNWNEVLNNKDRKKDDNNQGK